MNQNENIIVSADIKQVMTKYKKNNHICIYTLSIDFSNRRYCINIIC